MNDDDRQEWMEKDEQQELSCRAMVNQDENEDDEGVDGTRQNGEKES